MENNNNHASEPSPKTTNQRLRRPPLERMFRIHELLAAKQYPGPTSLAQEFEVSTKTIYRDIEYMKLFYNLPIEFEADRHGYYYTEENIDFPLIEGMKLTQQEFFWFLFARKITQQYQATPWGAAVQEAFSKIAACLDNNARKSCDSIANSFSVRTFAPEAIDPALINTLCQAVNDMQAVRFTYRNPGHKRSRVRSVHPYHVHCCENRWYLLGFDVHRQQIRTFALSRMKDVTVLSERFQRPCSFQLDNYFRDVFLLMKGDGDFHAVIEFDAYATDVLRGHQVHPSEKVEELADGRSWYTIHVSSLEEVGRWVLGWGTHATAISPPELVAHIRAKISALESIYADRVCVEEEERGFGA